MVRLCSKWSQPKKRTVNQFKNHNVLVWLMIKKLIQIIIIKMFINIFFVFCLMPVEHGMPMRKKNVKKKNQKTKFVLGSDCRVQIGVGVGHYLSCRLYKYFIE